MQDYGWVPPAIETGRPHPARMYDYYLGGKDNYPVDREAAEKVLQAAPEARVMARANRDYLERVVRFLVGEVGIRQIIDVGTGFPAADNVHEVAQGIAPTTRVLYADNDPIVFAHANALMVPTGTTRVIRADLRSPRDIVDGTRGLIDLQKPVALLLIAVLHFIKDEEDPAGIVKILLDALPRGSYLAMSHATGDLKPETADEVVKAYEDATSTLTVRNHQNIARFFDGCELVDPGLVKVPAWRPEADIPEEQDQVWIYGGVGRKL